VSTYVTSVTGRIVSVDKAAAAGSEPVRARVGQYSHRHARSHEPAGSPPRPHAGLFVSPRVFSLSLSLSLSCARSLLHTCIHAYMHTCMHAYAHTHTHTHTHTFIHTYTYVRTYIHTYTHTYAFIVTTLNSQPSTLNPPPSTLNQVSDTGMMYLSSLHQLRCLNLDCCHVTNRCSAGLVLLPV